MPKIVAQKVKNGHKNPISHNYHDENADEIEFYQENSNRNMTLDTRTTTEQRTPPKKPQKPPVI